MPCVYQFRQEGRNSLYTPEASLERRRRIRLAVFAYAYEYRNVSLVSDEEFDRLALEINKEQATGWLMMDLWFWHEFEPYTGSWIANHPDLDGIERIYNQWYRRKVS